MSADYDVIVLGGNVEGLVAANMLAKRGLSVALFENNNALGGLAQTEELIPGFQFNTGYQDAGLFSDELIDDLDLEKHGLRWLESDALAFAPQPNNTGQTLWRDLERTKSEMATLSPADAKAFGMFAEQARIYSAVLAEMARLAPPSLSYAPLGILASWAKVALKARRLGGRRMMNFLRLLPMDARHYLNEQFESEAIRGLFGALSVSHLMQGPRAAGTTFMLLYQLMGSASGYRRMRVPRGGLGALSAALASAAREHGVEIQTGVVSKAIQIENYRACGVLLESGEGVLADRVLSVANPRTTFLDWVGAPNLQPRSVRRLKNIKYRGSTATIHLALSGLPDFPAAEGNESRLRGTIVICPSLSYAERAYDDAKYGRFSQQPILDVRIPSRFDPVLAPAGQHTMTITYHYAPYQLRDGNWASHKDALIGNAIRTIKAYAPEIEGLILDRKAITPLDYERDYGCPEGSFTHGQMSLDQLLLMRPTSGFAGYRSPLHALYLGGPGAHPGGGLTGLAGRNAAQQVLKEL